LSDFLPKIDIPFSKAQDVT